MKSLSKKKTIGLRQKHEFVFFPKNFVVLESIKLLFAHPVLFLPKLLLAVLYGFGTLLSVDLAKELIRLYAVSFDQVAFSNISSLLFGVIVLLFLTLVSFFLDLFFSGWYPVLVEHARKGRISVLAAFSEVKPKLFAIFASGLIVLALIFVVSVIEAGIILTFNANDFGILLSFVVSFVFIFLFYFLYPIIVRKNLGLAGYFRENFSSTFSNKKKVFIYSFIPFSVSIIKFGVAFFADSAQVMVLFWVLVLLTAFVYTIHSVASQLLYLKISN